MIHYSASLVMHANFINYKESYSSPSTNCLCET